MATALHRTEHRVSADQLTKDKTETIPDIIEERRKDSDGRITINKFCTGKLLGKGGFAKCYLGTHLATNHLYALKIVSKSTLVKSKSKQKLQTEIKIHRTLRHTYVCKFERFFEDAMNVYIILELCSNNSMSELIKRRKRLTEPEVRYYIIQLVSSLQYLHENLVIHRDLKLGNLFLDSHMRIKVGDFGLATRLTDASERRRTFCGTPNYIAPEILQSKNGHSFEVDVWSTGVIIYTLLVGKPPFEAKDVEATYKRILTNSFTFPENHQISVCQHSKNLIRSILQTKASSRPTLEGILDHSFFTRSGAFTPTSLPESALREPPHEHVPLRLSADVLADQRKSYTGFDTLFGDENDPQIINRKISPKSIPKQKDFIKTRSNNMGVEDPAVKKDLQKSSNNAKTIISSTATNSGNSNSTSLPIVPPKGMQSTVPQGFVPIVIQTKKEKISIPIVPSLQSTNLQEKKIHANKFEIFQDNEIQQNTQNEKLINPDLLNPTLQLQQGRNDLNPVNLGNKVSQQLYLLKKPKEPLIISSKGMGAHRTYDHNTRTTIPSSSSNVNVNVIDKNETENMEMEILQSELEWFQLGNGNGTGTSHVPSIPAVQPNIVVPAIFRSKNQMTDFHHKTTEAWTDDDRDDVLHHFSKSVVPTVPTIPQGKINSNRLYNSPPQVAAGSRSDKGMLPHSSSKPMHLSPPIDQVMNSKEYKALGTLETMHEVLASTGLGLDNLHLQGQAFEFTLNTNKKSLYTVHHKADIWVVRYVDYTSKYGLGFLLNTGSAGVYFNDSTKIVISPNGSVFQYSERRRKDKGSTSSEHIIQTHLVSQYPAELQKKVTLLRHFRNYLVDQQNEGASKSDDGSATGGKEVLATIAITALDGPGVGANTAIPLGISSTILRPSDAIQMGCCPSSPSLNNEYENPKMPFIKKWVRTRHAILFRLSNKTVQVLFFDRSEVLLSSEARMVTYVNKQNVRSDHTLEEVLQTGRTDIAKRLKYAKDIMYRLISTQAS